MSTPVQSQRICVGPELAFSDASGALRIQQANQLAWPFNPANPPQPCTVSGSNGLNLQAGTTTSPPNNGLWTAPHGIYRYTDSQGLSEPGGIVMNSSGAASAVWQAPVNTFQIKNPSPCSQMIVYFWTIATIAVNLPQPTSSTLTGASFFAYNAAAASTPPDFHSSGGTQQPVGAAWNSPNSGGSYNWYDSANISGFPGTPVNPGATLTMYPALTLINTSSGNPTILAWFIRTMYVCMLVDPTQLGSV